jgi:hypothetical protein
MKKLIPGIILFFLFLAGAQAQPDLNLQYERPGYTDWNEVVNELYRDDVKFLEHSYYAGLAYRIFPFPFRLGFVPELGAGFSSISKSNNFYQGKYSLLQLAFSVPVVVFPMDLYGDCNCPTFGNQNDFFQKALFFKFIPGLSYRFMEYSGDSSNSARNLVYSVGAGAGLNIALNNKLTLAPEISYHRLFNVNWAGFSALHGQPDANDHSAADKISLGIRLSLYLE